MLGSKVDKLLGMFDDVIIFGWTFEETRGNLLKVLLQIRSYSLQIKLRKCELFKQEISLLGRVVSARKIHTDLEKLKAVTD